MAPATRTTMTAAAALAAALLGLLAPPARAQQVDGYDGVLAYPAEEHRISHQCFTGRGDEFLCGWYCLHAFYVATGAGGEVTIFPFGEGNLDDDAPCSECSLFEGTGYVAGGDLTAAGAVASGYLSGGYKWSAVYDAANEEVFVNFTDYGVPCEIKYLVMAGEVMGVPPAPGRPLKADGQATLELASTGGPSAACATTLPGCTTWSVRTSADVTDWQNLDEVAAQGLTCPPRVEPWSAVHAEFTGHDAAVRGSDGVASPGVGGGDATATRNTVLSFSPIDVARCEQYFAVVEGCYDGQGPGCGAQRARHSMAHVRAHVADVRARRARNQALKAAAAAKRGAGAGAGGRQGPAAADLAAAGAFEWSGPPPRGGGLAAWLVNPLGVDARAAAALWGLALALAATWARRRWAAGKAAEVDGYAAVPDGPQAARPLLGDARGPPMRV